MSTYVRINISLPQELRERMNACKDPINWSGVCQTAIEDKLEAVERAGADSSVGDAIARLRGTATKKVNDDYRRGLDAGRRWAMNTAAAAELQRLGDFYDRCEAGDGFEQWVADNRRGAKVGLNPKASAYGIMLNILADAETREIDHDGICIQQAMEIAPGFFGAKNLENDRFLSGFVHGALAFWNEVKGLI